MIGTIVWLIGLVCAIWCVLDIFKKNISTGGKVIAADADRSFSFITKTPPAAVLLKKACNLKSASAVPNKTKVATISKDKVREIAELKMPDLNAASIESAMSMIAGTARSMGIVVED